MAKKNLNPQNVAAKWSQNLGSAGQAYSDGVKAVSVSPGQSALANAQAYLNGVMQSFNNGTYQKGLQSFSLQDWQNAAINKGAQRLSSGASTAKSKMQSFFSAYIPQLQSIQSQVDGMPNDTYEARKARANFVMDSLHALKGTLKQ